MSAISEVEVSQPDGVSPLRRKISAVVLVILAVVLTVEIRAGVGHMLTGRALQEKGPDGAFVDTTYAEVQEVLSLGPAQSTIRESDSEIEYKYHWFSLLRPVFQRPAAAYYVTVNRASPAQALRYSMEPPSAEELGARKRNADATTDPIDDMAMTAGGPGGFGGGGGFGGPGGPPGGGLGGPVRDPLVATLDRNNDGELSEEELENAAAALLAADKNGDGVLSGDEIQPAQTSGSPVRRRPPMEDEEEAAAPDQPASEGDEDPNSEAVKTDEAKEINDTSESANIDDRNN